LPIWKEHSPDPDTEDGWGEDFAAAARRAEALLDHGDRAGQLSKLGPVDTAPTTSTDGPLIRAEGHASARGHPLCKP
jgi:hypothetical protein